MHMQINDYIKHGLKKKLAIMPTSCTWLSAGWHPNPATISIPGCMEAVKRMAANPKDVVHNLPRCLISLGRLGGKRALEGWRNKWWELKASNVVLLTKCKKRKSLLIKSGRSAGHESQADLRKEILQRTPFYVGPCWPCQRHLVLFCWQDLEGQGLLAGLSRTGWGEKPYCKQ